MGVLDFMFAKIRYAYTAYKFSRWVVVKPFMVFLTGLFCVLLLEWWAYPRIQSSYILIMVAVLFIYILYRASVNLLRSVLSSRYENVFVKYRDIFNSKKQLQTLLVMLTADLRYLIKTDVTEPLRCGIRGVYGNIRVSNVGARIANIARADGVLPTNNVHAYDLIMYETLFYYVRAGQHNKEKTNEKNDGYPKFSKGVQDIVEKCYPDLIWENPSMFDDHLLDLICPRLSNLVMAHMSFNATPASISQAAKAWLNAKSELVTSEINGLPENLVF